MGGHVRVRMGVRLRVRVGVHVGVLGVAFLYVC